MGNGCAVVHAGANLPEEVACAFVGETSLVECTFTGPSETADLKVRYFLASREIPFAGHPTLGSCAAWLHGGGVPKTPGVVRQECGVGVVDIDLTGVAPAFVAPPTTVAPMTDDNFEAIVERLSIPRESILHTAELNNGPVWQAFHMASAEAVMALDSSRVRWPEFKALGFIGPQPDGHECDYEVRMLAPSSGMSEDPITGSLNSALAHWMRSDGRLQGPVTVAQGTSIDRYGRVSIRPDGDRVLIGGESHVLIEGTVDL